MKFRTNTIILVATIAAFFTLFGESCYSKNKCNVILAYGRPAGFLDFNANVMLSAKLPSVRTLTPMVLLQESFSTKKDQPIPEYEKESVRIYYSDLTFYALAQKQIWLPRSHVYPFVSAGWGLHIINSWTGEYNFFESRQKSTSQSALWLR